MQFTIFTTPSLRHKLSPTHTLRWPGRNRVQITCNASGTHHMQYVVCHLAWKDSSAIKVDRVKIAFYFSFILLVEPLINEGGEETPDEELHRHRKVWPVRWPQQFKLGAQKKEKVGLSTVWIYRFCEGFCVGSVNRAFGFCTHGCQFEPEIELMFSSALTLKDAQIESMFSSALTLKDAQIESMFFLLWLWRVHRLSHCFLYFDFERCTVAFNPALIWTWQCNDSMIPI